MTGTDTKIPNLYNIGILGVLKTVDLSSTGDQPITINNKGYGYSVGGIFAYQANATPTTSTFTLYTGTGKTGSTMANVSSAVQSLNPGTTDWVSLTISSTGKLNRTNSTLYLSCTGTTASKTCNVAVFGGTLDPGIVGKVYHPFGTLTSGIGVIGLQQTTNLNTTADQAITINNKSQPYFVQRFFIQNGSTTFSAPIGGVYTGTGKTGTQVIPNTQTWALTPGTTDTASSVFSAPNQGSALTNSVLYVALSTANGSAATCDTVLLGVIDLPGSSTGTYVNSKRADIIGTTRSIPLDSTADTAIKLNINGLSTISGGSGNANIGQITGVANLSSGTVTNFAGFTGTGRTGTQLLTNANLTSTAKTVVFKAASVGNIIITNSLYYLSCSSTTASAGAIANFTAVGTVLP